MGNLGDSAGKFFACLVVTHANIFTSVRSTAPRRCGFTAERNAPLPRCPDESGPRAQLRCTVLPRYIFGAHVHRPVSCYAIFQGWLLLSKPPGCLSTCTSFSTEQYLGTLASALGYFPFDDGSSLSPSHSRGLQRWVFGVCQDLVGRSDPRIQTVALPPTVPHEAAPKGISRRTSYLRVRLAFHSYTQVIRGSCDIHRCGPPSAFRQTSSCSSVAHPVSGLVPATGRPIRTRFRSGSG